jgi:uncharacterized protein (DUF1697 family)
VTTIALLRGINVGGRNRLAMADLRQVLAGLGYGNPQTYIQSGNALFDTGEGEAEVADRIGDALHRAVGLRVGVVVRSASELAAALAASPFGTETDGTKVGIAFFRDLPDPAAVAATDPERFLPDRFAVIGRDVHCWFPAGMGRSKLAGAPLLTPATLRNVRTVAAVVDLAAAR